MAARSARYWPEAATLILATRVSKPNVKVTQPFDYKVLMLKRSAKSSFFPSAYVFPGGVASEADFSDSWANIFMKVSGKSLGELAQEFKVSAPRPPMIQEIGSSGVCGDVAFRICAIRETFEESGLLLVRDKSSLRQSAANTTPKGSVLESDILLDWRQKIEKDAGNFVKMCETLEVVPDIWALSEWCNWLTPVFTPVDAPPARPKRYDTLFYVCCLDSHGMPTVQPDNKETHAPEWMTPGEFLSPDHPSHESLLKMGGPQLYELGRLSQFPLLEHLSEFSHQRAKLGTERWMTVYFFCKDGAVSLLPGDDAYPEHPDYEGTKGEWPKTQDATCHQMNSAVQHLHRSTRKKGKTRDEAYELMCNIPLACGHVPPVFSLRIPKAGLL